MIKTIISKLKIAVIVLLFFFFLQNLSGQTPIKPLKITHLTNGFYIFESYNFYKGEKISANAMYLVTSAGVVLFDTPWDTTQFQPLLDSIKTRHNLPVVLCIATHFHEDRTGGLEYYRRHGIKTFSTRHTDELSIKRGMKRAESVMNNDSTFTVGECSFETYYPGHGHSPDNIVIWFKKEKLLYGGCLIKSSQDQTLGNLNDANAQAYPHTIKNVIKKCRHPKYVIPGHNNWKNPAALLHTLKMARNLKENPITK
jgi:metallo-beta-lactamase class B